MHPSLPSASILKPLTDYNNALLTAPYGYAVEVSLHAMRLIYSGLFDKCPKLKIILGHMGEGLPYWLYRMDFRWLKPVAGKSFPIGRKPSDYIKTNFFITTSGMFYQPALICAYLALGAERILFAVDYPYEDDKEALQFMKEAPLSDGDKEKIYHLNAEKLFKL